MNCVIYHGEKSISVRDFLKEHHFTTVSEKSYVCYDCYSSFRKLFVAKNKFEKAEKELQEKLSTTKETCECPAKKKRTTEKEVHIFFIPARLSEVTADRRQSKMLTLKAPPIVCSRRQFRILPLFQNNK